MYLLPQHPRVLVVVTMAALALAGCSASTASSDSTEAAHTATSSHADTASAKQRYLDHVSALCDALLPKVIRVTQGGSLEPSSFRFTAEYSIAARQIAELEVYEPRVTTEGFPASKDVVPVVLEP